MAKVYKLKCMKKFGRQVDGKMTLVPEGAILEVGDEEFRKLQNLPKGHLTLVAVIDAGEPVEPEQTTDTHNDTDGPEHDVGGTAVATSVDVESESVDENDEVVENDLPEYEDITRSEWITQGENAGITWSAEDPKDLNKRAIYTEVLAHLEKMNSEEN